MDLPITDTGSRPGGWKGRCFYCHEPLVNDKMTDHKADCVLVRRSIVLRMHIDYIVEVPKAWTEEEIRFFYNDSSHCADNEFNQIAGEIDDEGICLCHRASNEYIREATEADHEDL